MWDREKRKSVGKAILGHFVRRPTDCKCLSGLLLSSVEWPGKISILLLLLSNCILSTEDLFLKCWVFKSQSGKYNFFFFF